MLNKTSRECLSQIGESRHRGDQPALAQHVLADGDGLRRVYRERADGTEAALPGKTNLRIARGDRMIADSSGGGYGVA
ncbi:hypothetical protein [Thalassobaculum salexigens]|uniref:hypothetical protein n=1 Tax=Thalassobaculum salexigens TaxID=455360 RepID=UPI0003F5242C|nr:hypothetical protein [Thalassobaculum salexigens]